MAWNATLPADDSLLINTPGYLRANWAAIVLGTDSDLLVTNAKVSPTAAIVDTKLAQITTASKVAGSALTTLSGTPAGAGNMPLANIPSTLTGKSADQLDGQEGSYYLALGNATGTLAVARGGLGASFAATLQGNIFYFSATGVISALVPGTSGQYLKTQGAGANPKWDDLETISKYQNGTTYTVISATTERISPQNNINPDFVKLKQLSPLVRGGSVTITWQYSSKDPTWNAQSKLYINDIAVGSLKEVVGQAWKTTTESNVTVEKDDVIQIYGRGQPGTEEKCYVQNLYVKTENPIDVEEVSGY